MDDCFAGVGLRAPQMLLPNESCDMSAWAVVACDQYTSQPEYWEGVKNLVGEKPSTLKLIIPEVYLETPEEDALLTSINDTMVRYLEDGTLRETEPALMLVDRTLPNGAHRLGLVAALDLECYDYNAGSETLIRATEGTILDRLPPRIRVREGAVIELPHIMVLIDDPERTVIEPLDEAPGETMYDFDLMCESGHITGKAVTDAGAFRAVGDALAALAEPAGFNARYGVSGQAPLLYAMGDGNHSLATAKAIWEQLKEENGGAEALGVHPARWALVELVNLHDASLEFEAIHRVVFGVTPAALQDAFVQAYAAESAGFETCDSAEVAQMAWTRDGSAHAIPVVSEAGWGLLKVENPRRTLAVATLQDFLDDYLSTVAGAKLDYIHGEDVVEQLGSAPGNMGFLLPSIAKDTFFKSIVCDGAFPRKTFSMGEAADKRFYLECRRIRP